MGSYKDWSDGWLKEDYFISFREQGICYYEQVIARDFAHYEYPWNGSASDRTPESIPAAGQSGNPSGPFTPEELEITKGYNDRNNLNRLWQLIFGIKGQVLISIELPTDMHRHGIPKIAKPGSTVHRVAHYEEYMSPYFQPSFITEHFMMRPTCSQISFEAYNPNTIALTDVWLNIFIAKIVTERIGTESNGVLTPTKDRFREILAQLAAKTKRCRPISLLPVTAPAEAPSGE